ncbi:DUF4133 domain-containing protein [Puia dinghuensis]|uniref:DUF4133 domain-containing protein n=1 Tax=Puia dinghuensis TaxID=1792502 RepID=A0A8J2XTT1_9BACT|nr:DUF4133 domain-containing protein [Puia dinghuensis]GGB20086.1 hypothetical protein GCM10011511_49760 [Puia dinghuensis]
MKTEVYTINKGVNRAVEFRGLQAQYIWWLGGGIVSMLALFAVLYIFGLNPFVCLGIITVAGTVLFREVYRMSRTYGQHGLMKKAAARRLPNRIRAGTRKPFLREGNMRQKN